MKKLFEKKNRKAKEMVGLKERQEAERRVLIRAHVFDAADAIRSSVTTSNAPAGVRRTEVVCSNSRLAAAIEEYATAALKQEGDFFVPSPSSEAMRETVGFEASSELVDRTISPNLDALGKLGEDYKALRSLAALRSGTTGGPLQRYLDQSLTTVSHLIQMVKGGFQPSSASWAAVPAPLLCLMRGVVDQPTIQDKLEEQEEQLRRIEFAVEECTMQQQQAVADGDMKEVELLYFKKIAIQESMVQLFDATFESIDAAVRQLIHDPTARLREQHEKATGELHSMMKSQNNLCQRVQNDIVKLRSAVSRIQCDNTSSRSQFETFCASTTEQLNSNAKAIDTVLSGIDSLEKQLQSLAVSRVDLVRRQVEAIDREAHRRREVLQFEKFSTTHIMHLEATVEQCKLNGRTTDVIDQLTCSGCNALEQQLRLVASSIEEKRLEMLERRLEHFRGVYLTLGDLQYKKERNLEELDKKISNIHIQQEVAMDTLNPKARELAQTKKDLLKVRDEMESQVQAIGDKAALQIEWFRPTEAALAEVGKAYEHPVKELERKNNERQVKLLQYHQLMASQEAAAEERAPGESAAATNPSFL